MNDVIEQSPLPSRHMVRTLVEDLIGRDVQLRDANPIPAKNTNLVAVYVTDRLTVSAVAVVDLEAAARFGGALGMLPKGSVEESLAARGLTTLIRENAYEVLNVLSAAFNIEGAPHVRLYQLYGPDGSVPADVTALSQVIGSRLDVEITVAGYGNGRLSIITR
jgi:hypothetical protein